jgi:uncharacterized RDD family membrane protein YckC
VTFGFKTDIIKILLGALAFLFLAAPGLSQTPQAGAPMPIHDRIWAVGNDQGVFLAAAQRHDKAEGLRIYHRKVNQDEFTGGRWFSGQADLMALYDQRLLIYYQGGAAQSYDPIHPRTEMRIPPDFTPLACADWNGKLFVLARAKQAVRLSLKTEESPSNPAPNPESVASSRQSPQADNRKNPQAQEPAATLSFQPGDYLIITPAGFDQWQAMHRDPLPLAKWEKISLAVLDDHFCLFGVRRDEANREFLVCGILKQAQWSANQEIDAGPISEIHPLMVNQRAMAVIYAGLSKSQTPAVHYRLGTLQADQWVLTAPLARSDGKILEIAPQDVAVAAFGQNIAVFERSNDGPIRWSLYAADGSLLQPAADAINISRQDGSLAQPWLFRQELIVFMTVLIMAVVLWRREELVFTPELLNQPFIIAPWWRRACAFILDAIPADIVSSLVHRDLAEKIMTDQTFWEQSTRGDYPPELMTIYLTFVAILLTYFTVCELTIGATPGKMMMGLVVRDRLGGPATLRQRLIRNLMRLLECHPGVLPMIALVMLMTRCRQRPGDLAARTIVVFVPRDGRVISTDSSDAARENPQPHDDERPHASDYHDNSRSSGNDSMHRGLTHS